MGKTVTIGTEEKILEEFSGYKAFAAMEQLKVIFEAGPAIDSRIAAYVRTYESENAVVLDRATALHRFPGELEHLSDQDWAASGNQLKVPQSPDGLQIAFAALPVAIEIAKTETIRLLGLLILTNQELEDADNAGGDEAVDKEITARAKRLMHEARGSQLLELAVVSVELLEEEFADTVASLGGRLGNALKLLGLGTNPSEPEQPTESSEPTEPETPESAPTASSSTSSAEPTAGTNEPPSTEPAGVASPSSAG